MAHNFSLGTVQVALAPQERFTEFLQSRGKRITQQRKIIVAEVFKRHAHFDAEDLIGHLSSTAGGRRVSRPTVYRTLSEVVDAGLLRSMSLGGRTVYEHDYGYPQHDHLHCQRCKKLIEFRSEEVASSISSDLSPLAPRPSWERAARASEQGEGATRAPRPHTRMSSAPSSRAGNRARSGAMTSARNSSTCCGARPTNFDGSSVAARSAPPSTT